MLLRRSVLVLASCALTGGVVHVDGDAVHNRTSPRSASQPNDEGLVVKPRRPVSEVVAETTSLRGWWDAEHTQQSVAVYRSSNLDTFAARPARFAVVIVGLLRTWGYSLPSLERCVLTPNAPVDVFARLSVDLDVDYDVIKKTLATIQRREVVVAHFNLPTLSAIASEIGAPCTSQKRECVPSNVARHKSAESKGILNNYRSRFLAFAALEAHAQRRNQTYDAVVLTRPDIAFPHEPLFLNLVANQHPHLLIPASIDVPLNDQFALGSQVALRHYASAYAHCSWWPSKPGITILTHPCGFRQAGLRKAIKSHLEPERPEALRRFWFEYYILRETQLRSYKQAPDTWTKAHNPIVCRGELSWRMPTASAASLVNLNTTCSCDPASLPGVKRRRGIVMQSEVLFRYCNYDGVDYCHPSRACKFSI
ncbi:unnamed protein product [Pelagomonas calceolata]|uniref:Protein xylosyltransferase n=1 Tax=Pelagomonas calceolata TaxID=35677 RepID=A0A8J2SCC3_9STRA|nr:unnamed protein product [Pelagomonas calceolata]|mmetsp:Transcript_15692/g.44644  ORF Transcript_15692/g.44644 Transcript_15692/m.44644 type:complete len:423 (+) Transcript_15692:26-1294(+)